MVMIISSEKIEINSRIILSMLKLCFVQGEGFFCHDVSGFFIHCLCLNLRYSSVVAHAKEVGCYIKPL